MNAISWTSVLFYCVFSNLIYCQLAHAQNFRGSSKIFEILLSVSAITGTLTGFIYLVYYGWTVIWWAPIVILIIGILSSIPYALIESRIGHFTLSMVTFVAWPVLAYFMFQYIPMIG
jgi:hypothetical protein